MEPRLTIYCEVGFLDHYFEIISKFPNPHDDEASDNYFEIRKLNKLFESRINLVIDAESLEELKDRIKHNGFYRKLIMKSTEGQNTLIFDPEVFKKIKDLDKAFFDDLSKHELFLLDVDITTGREIQNKSRILTLVSHEVSQRVPHLFVDIYDDITEGQNIGPSWFNTNFGNLKFPISFLLLNDDYIIKEENFDNNIPIIMQWVQAIYKTQKPKKGMLSIISSKMAEITGKHKRLRGEFDRKFNINIVKSKIHNRWALTNYYALNIGYGFGFFSSETSKDDTLFLKSIFLPKNKHNGITGFDHYTVRYNLAKKAYKEAKNTYESFIGDVHKEFEN